MEVDVDVGVDVIDVGGVVVIVVVEVVVVVVVVGIVVVVVVVGGMEDVGAAAARFGSGHSACTVDLKLWSNSFAHIAFMELVSNFRCDLCSSTTWFGSAPRLPVSCCWDCRHVLFAVSTTKFSQILRMCEEVD